MMDAVGRCRPPFARTLLFHGTLPFPLPADLHSGEGHGRHWVVKRWPNNSSAARRKIGGCFFAISFPKYNIVVIISRCPSRTLSFSLSTENSCLLLCNFFPQISLLKFLLMRYLSRTPSFSIFFLFPATSTYLNNTARKPV